VTWTHPAYEAVARLASDYAGLSFAPPCRDGAELGIRRAMARAGITDPGQYRDAVAAGGQALDALLTELTVAETYFFREPAQFEILRREVLPEIRGRRGRGGDMRAWSAGCATGEEAYSLAILFEQEDVASQARILATDISRSALARARRATYGEWSLRGTGAAAARPYLHRQGERYVLDEKIRRRVTFDYLNLALDAYPSFATGTWAIDILLCRNVLLYLDGPTIQRVAGRLFEALAPGGWLLTAASDPPLAGLAPYETVVTDAGVFYRRPAVPDPRPAEKEGEAPPREATRAALTEPAASGVATARDRLAEANEAFARGDYVRAVDLTHGLAEDAAVALHVRALANLDAVRAERACAEASGRLPLNPELHYLRAVLLIGLGRDEEATQALRRVLYLDRSLALAQGTLASVLERRGDVESARRAYHSARDLCRARPAEEIVPLSDGERAGRLAAALDARLATLDPSGEART
jgi:chemotaxis protein methyltransferase CheR